MASKFWASTNPLSLSGVRPPAVFPQCERAGPLAPYSPVTRNGRQALWPALQRSTIQEWLKLPEFENELKERSRELHKTFKERILSNALKETAVMDKHLKSEDSYFQLKAAGMAMRSVIVPAVDLDQDGVP
jgi:hypothetical protein